MGGQDIVLKMCELGSHLLQKDPSVGGQRGTAEQREQGRVYSWLSMLEILPACSFPRW